MRRSVKVSMILLLVVAGAGAAQRPPQARRADVAVMLHGERIADPYRWMEDMTSAETRAWAVAQDSFARAWVAGPARDGLRARIARLAAARPVSPPFERAGHYYNVRYNSTGGAADITLLGRRGLSGQAREIQLSSDPVRHPVRAVLPAQKAPLAVVALGTDAGSWRYWGIYDLARGVMLRDTLHDVHSASSVAWSDEDRVIYYARYRMPPRDSLTSAPLSLLGVYRHRLGTAQSADSLMYAPSDPSCVVTPFTAETGTSLIVQESCSGSTNSLIALGHGIRVLLAAAEGVTYRFAGSVGEVTYWQTNAEAPNHRIVSLRMNGATPVWRTVVPENELPLFSWSGSPLGANLVGRTLLLAYQKDAIAAVRAYDLEGRFLRDVELPEIGSIWSGFVGSPNSTEAFYSVSGVASPGTIYRLDLSSGRSTVWTKVDIDLALDAIVTEQVFVRSKDGTRFPMFVVRRKDMPMDGTAPAWIYGYGFGDWSASPYFQPHIAEFIERGGVWALPNIRGGAEYGSSWSAAGSRVNKPNSVADYIAASEFLIEKGYTSARGLVANASSAGGIVGAAAMVQRPDLYGAVILDYPVLDMLRYHLFTVAATWKGGYGTAEDAAEFRVLRSLSAPHTIRHGVCFPPVLVAPGELDQITPPFHAYKFVAELQHASGCDTHPALLRVSWGAGHSAGRTPSDRVETWADQLLFIDKVLDNTLRRHLLPPDPRRDAPDLRVHHRRRAGGVSRARPATLRRLSGLGYG